jgi:hypothetical protein
LLAQFDSFGNFEIPQITLCNPDGRALGILSNLSDRQMNIRFNDLSDLSFTIQRGAKECRCPVYEQVEPFRYLLVDGIGYFVITDVSVSEEGNDAFKTVEASSCEYELNNIQLGYYEGTYRFYSGDDSDPKNSLLSDIMKRLPSWRLDTDGIPAAVAARSRTFDTTDQTVYAFLMTELEEAYECLFEFDILNRVIRVYDRYQYDNRTDICLSTEDVLQGLTLRTKSDEIKTALLVKGGNGLDILSVNPLGTNLIYNFSYYATEEWMDAALIEKVKNWQAHVDALTSSENSAFQVQRAEISKLQGRKAEKEGEITRLKQELSNLQVQQSAIISDTASQDIKNANLKALHPQILAAKSALSTAEGALSSIQTQLNTENDKLLALQKQVRLESVFTPAEMEVLSRFIQQGAYTEENITKQDNMSYEEAQAQALELYNKAQSLLKTISTPRYEYSVETASFVFQKEFAHLTSQLKSGCLIDIRLSEEDIASLLLLEMAVDYDGRSLSLTFGNRYKLSDPSALFNDLVGGSIAKTASTVEYLRTTFDFKQQKDDLDHLAELKDESINLTHNMVVNADNQVMVIDASGINGRRAVIGEDGLPTGDYEPEVLKITNNTIAFSTDDFETTETVLGKNLLPDGATTPDGKNYMYGLNAKLLMGDLIIGENLKVSGEIEGNIIKANSIAANQLKIGDSTNLIQAHPDMNPDGLKTETVDGKKYFITKELNADGTAKPYSKIYYLNGYSLDFSVGDSYHFSFYGKISNGKQIACILRLYYVHEEGKEDYVNLGRALIDSKGDSFTNYSITFTLTVSPDQNRAYRNWFFCCENFSDTASPLFYQRDVKLYRMATDVMIKDGAVTANKIVANAITTDKLAANCITTDKMMIGDYNNLIQKNPDSNPEGIPVTTVNGIRYFNVGTTQYSSRIAARGYNIDFKKGDSYVFEMTAIIPSGRRITVGMRMHYQVPEYDSGTASNTVTFTSNLVAFTGTGSAKKYSAKITISKDINVSRVPLYWDFFIENTVAGTPPTYIRDLFLRRCTSGELIVDGVIRSSDGESYFDLNNGKIVGKNAEMNGSFTANAISTDASLLFGTKAQLRGFEMPNPPSNLDTLTKLANWINSLKFAGLYFYDVKGGEAGSISTLACSMNGNGAIDYRAVIIKTRDTANARSTISLCDQAGENSIADITADTIDLWGKKRIDLHGEVYPSSHVRMINQAQLQGYTTGGTQELLAQKSGGNNAVYGLATQTGNTHIYTRTGGAVAMFVGTAEKVRVDGSGIVMYGSNAHIRSNSGAAIKFYISGQLCGYIDKSGWHNA